MINSQDINRLVQEITIGFNAQDELNIEPIEDWCKKQGISDDAIHYLSEILMQLWRQAAAEEIAAGEPLRDAVYGNIEASILMAFTIGWEASREYGKTK